MQETTTASWETGVVRASSPPRQWGQSSVARAPKQRVLQRDRGTLPATEATRLQIACR
jgi:hypothetical protein